MRERLVLDDGNVIPVRDLANFRSQQIAPFGHHHRSRHQRVIFERNGIGGRVGNHHGSALGIFEHPAPPHLPLQPPNPRLDQRIALAFLVFVHQFLAAHFELALEVAALEKVIEKGPEQEHECGLPAHLKHARRRESSHAVRIT